MDQEQLMLEALIGNNIDDAPDLIDGYLLHRDGELLPNQEDNVGYPKLNLITYTDIIVKVEWI